MFGMADIRVGEALKKPVKRSSRTRGLAVQPVSERDWDIIRAEGG
ncbi:MAG TPA: hypothetical protein VIH87_12090 [Methylocella sp.]